MAEKSADLARLGSSVYLPIASVEHSRPVSATP